MAQSVEMNPRVPYARLRAAEHAALDTFPDALSVKALWTPASESSDVHVEVEVERGHKSMWSAP